MFYRESCGIGYLILPSNMGYGEYVSLVNRTGLASIQTDSNAIIHQCPITVTALDNAVFPIAVGELGSAVFWINNERTNSAIIVDCLVKGDEIGSFDRTKVWKNSNTTGASNSSVTLHEQGQIAIVANNANKSPKITIQSQQGDVEIEGELVSVIAGALRAFANDNIEHVVKDDNQQQLSLKISSTLMELGGGEYSSVLGESLQTQLQNLSLRLDTLLNAIKSAPITPSDGGLAFKTGLIAAIAGLATEDYSKILSTKIKLQ